MKSTALARLLQGITKPSHDKRPSIETFADIDTDRLAAELNLAGRGRERGGNEEPATSSETMDSVETQIIERIEAAKKAAHATIEDELRTYAERLAALDFEDRFTQIQHTAPAAVGDFKLEARAGRDDLYALRRNLRDLRSRIEQIQAMLTAEVKEIHTAYQTTMDEYQQLDDVVPEPGMGDGSKQA